MNDREDHHVTTHLCDWCGNEPAPHAALCKRCTRTLRRGLRNVGSYYVDLDTVEQRATRHGDSGATMGGPSKSVPLVVDARFLEAADAIDDDPKSPTYGLKLGRGTELRAEAITTIGRWAGRIARLHPQIEWPTPAPGPACADQDCTHTSCATATGRWTPVCSSPCRHEACITWKRRLHPQPIRGRDGTLHPPTVPAMVAYLIRMTGSIVTEHWAGELMADVLDLENRLRRIVDRPADRWYAGTCGAITIPDQPHDGTGCACACHNAAPGLIACDIPGGCGLEYTEPVVCEQPLQADPTKPFVHCRTCGATHDVADRREALRIEAEDRLATVEVIVRIVTTLGDRDVSMSRINARIRQWATRNQITAHGTRVVDGRERPIYRIGDVLDRLNSDAQQKARTDAERAHRATKEKAG